MTMLASATEMVASMMSRRLLEDDDTFVADPYQLATVLFVIVAIFIVLTIGFVIVKDWVMESSSKYVRPIILVIFGEMTVLGFLSVLTFIIAYGGTLDELSTILFGSAGSTFIDSTLERIHYMLFLVMILAIVEVFLLIGIGNVSMANFEEMNIVSQDKEKIAEYVARADKLPHVTYYSWMYDYFTNWDPREVWARNAENIKATETLMFYSMRREFIECRNPLPPYELAPKTKWLPNNFDYAKYQTIFLSNYMVQVVSFTPLTWLALWLVQCVIIAVMLALDGWYEFLAIFWLFFGWLDMISVYVLQDLCISISENLVNPAHFRPSKGGEGDDEEGGAEGVSSSSTSSSGLKEEPTETTSLLGGVANVGDVAGNLAQEGMRNLNPFPTGEPGPGEKHSNVVRRALEVKTSKPIWTTIKDQPQSWISWLFLGNVVPNKQEQLFWGDKVGRDLNIYILRVHILFQSIYISVGLCIFVPYMFDIVPVWWACVYLVFILLPIPIQFVGFYPTLIPVMSHIACTGLFKDQKTVVDVLAQMKMAKLVRLMGTMTSLKSKRSKDDDDKKLKYDPNDPRLKVEIAEMSKIFDIFDEKKTGEIGTEQLGKLFKAMGISLTDRELQEVMMNVDADGSGSVSKQEFIDWKISHKFENKAEAMTDLAKRIFSVFDVDANGEVSVEDFKRAIKDLDPTISEKELVQIAVDIDESGDGMISFDEFKAMVMEAMGST